MIVAARAWADDGVYSLQTLQALVRNTDGVALSVLREMPQKNNLTQETIDTRRAKIAMMFARLEWIVPFLLFKR